MKHKLIITGASDDLIEISGDYCDEIGWYHDDEMGYLSISDGTLLSVVYDDDGIWRFFTVSRGSAKLSKEEGITDEDTNDVITLESDQPFKHVLFGTKLARP